jgi:hypothetical protein
MLDAMAAAVPDIRQLAGRRHVSGCRRRRHRVHARQRRQGWIGQPLAEPAARKLKRKVVAINDADAAGSPKCISVPRATSRHGARAQPRYRHRQRAVRRRQARA